MLGSLTESVDEIRGGGFRFALLSTYMGVFTAVGCSKKTKHVPTAQIAQRIKLPEFEDAENLQPGTRFLGPGPLLQAVPGSQGWLGYLNS